MSVSCQIQYNSLFITCHSIYPPPRKTNISSLGLSHGKINLKPLYIKYMRE